jgi:hypothetical protein
MLLVARRHVGLERIYQGTRWSGAVWSQALEDLPGSGGWGPTHFAGAPSTRCTALPVAVLPPLEDNFDERPTPREEIETD